MNATANRYYIIHKPYKMVSQFVSSHNVRLLGSLNYIFPEGIHAIGRLDNHSEGLLILTTDKRITRLLFESSTPHKRVYLVQVKKLITEEALHQLRNGVTIQVKGGGDYLTTPCEVELVNDPTDVIPFREELKEYPPFSWILITLTEGKYHQVRKMVSAVGHQCKRLIRVAIEELTLSDLQSGQVREIPEKDFFRQLHLITEVVENAV